MIIPACYTPFRDVFCPRRASQLSPHQPWDCAIDSNRATSIHLPPLLLLVFFSSLPRRRKAWPTQHLQLNPNPENGWLEDCLHNIYRPQWILGYAVWFSNHPLCVPKIYEWDLLRVPPHFILVYRWHPGVLNIVTMFSSCLQSWGKTISTSRLRSVHSTRAQLSSSVTSSVQKASIWTRGWWKPLNPGLFHPPSKSSNVSSGLQTFIDASLKTTVKSQLHQPSFSRVSPSLCPGHLRSPMP